MKSLYLSPCYMRLKPLSFSPFYNNYANLLNLRPRYGDFYRFTIADNGQDIDPQYHQKIFGIFQSLTSKDDKESTGISLSIIKKAVENQDGKVKLESQLGERAAFSFTWKK